MDDDIIIISVSRGEKKTPIEEPNTVTAKDYKS